MTNIYFGEIRLFAGSQPPTDWAFCHGQILNIADHGALYSLLGTSYGGNGTTTFALPDLRGRVAVGTGQPPGEHDYKRGDMGGMEDVILTAENMPAHTHSLAGTTAAAATGPDGGVLAATQDINSYLAAGPDPVSMSPQTIGEEGQGSPIDNMQPTLTLNYMICLNGDYPSRG